MSDEITPALTREEWAWWQSGTDTWLEIARTRNGRVHVDPKRYRDAVRPTLVMALANAALSDDDPRKITRADIAGMLEYDYYKIDAVAAKLAALLPPED